MAKGFRSAAPVLPSPARLKWHIVAAVRAGPGKPGGHLGEGKTRSGCDVGALFPEARGETHGSLRDEMSTAERKCIGVAEQRCIRWRDDEGPRAGPLSFGGQAGLRVGWRRSWASAGGACFAGADRCSRLHLEDVDVMGQAVEERTGQALEATALVHSSNGKLLVTMTEPRS